MVHLGSLFLDLLHLFVRGAGACKTVLWVSLVDMSALGSGFLSAVVVVCPSLLVGVKCVFPGLVHWICQ